MCAESLLCNPALFENTAKTLPLAEETELCPKPNPNPNSNLAEENKLRRPSAYRAELGKVRVMAELGEFWFATCVW